MLVLGSVARAFARDLTRSSLARELRPQGIKLRKRLSGGECIGVNLEQLLAERKRLCDSRRVFMMGRDWGVP
jgi:hypothetical protein